MSSDPVALDRLLYDRINAMRLLEGFPEIEPIPRQLPFAASLQLGEFDRDRIQVKVVALPVGGVRVRSKPANVTPLTEQPEGKSWLRRMMSW
jgi:hypothetical protein